ncbi:MAG: hypothetical protein AAGG51_26440 [Cyanobacteria bacterium P01_G01_bin.54]
MPRYLLYGRQVQSNWAIADLLPSAGTAAFDLDLLFGVTPDWANSQDTSRLWRTSRRQQLQVWRWSDSQPLDPQHPNPQQPSWQRFCWRYQDGCTFWLDHRLDPQTPTRIWLTWPNDLSPEDAITYLLGPVLAFVVRLDSQVCLHASAVALPQGAVLFLGPAGAGKSTTAAILAGQGCPVLTDDVVVLQETRAGGFAVSPGYPRLRLWPGSAELLYGDRQALPRLVPSHPTWDKQYLDLRQPGLDFPTGAVPLAQIYCLARRSSSGISKIIPISPQAAWRQLTANTSVNYLLDRPHRQQEFELFGRLLPQIPCYTLAVTQDPNRFAQLYPQLLAKA